MKRLVVKSIPLVFHRFPFVVLIFVHLGGFGLLYGYTFSFVGAVSEETFGRDRGLKGSLPFCVVDSIRLRLGSH